VEARSIDLAGTDDLHRHAPGGPQHRPEEELALLAQELLRVVQQTEGYDATPVQLAVVEQHGRRHERPREAAPSRLVGPGHEPDAEAPVEGDQATAASHSGRA
jgi:hypothetical protein